jgi:hypothetical protein
MFSILMYLCSAEQPQEPSAPPPSDDEPSPGEPAKLQDAATAVLPAPDEPRPRVVKIDMSHQEPSELWKRANPRSSFSTDRR